MLIKVGRKPGVHHAERDIDAPFVMLADGDTVPAAGAIIVSLKRFGSEKDALLSRAFPLGVVVESGASPQDLGEDVHRLAVVVLRIPYFKDGRAFSAARLLRTRLGYKGEIRVTGHFLRDQIAFFVRVGVDTFDCSQNISVAEVEDALREISHVYQPSVDGQKTILDLRAAKRLH